MCSRISFNRPQRPTMSLPDGALEQKKSNIALATRVINWN